MTHDTAVHVRGYLTIFATLLVLTVVTVGVSYLSLPAGPTVAIGLAIATAKATLVAAFFMHLRHERALIVATMAATVVLAVSLFALTAWTEADHVPGTRFGSPFTVTAAEGAEGAAAGTTEGEH